MFLRAHVLLLIASPLIALAFSWPVPDKLIMAFYGRQPGMARANVQQQLKGHPADRHARCTAQPVTFPSCPYELSGPSCNG
jgi:hypothetical protein